MSWWRREPSGAAAPQASRIVADLAGATISGQVAVGEHIVQIHAEHGAVVNYVEAPRRPVPRLRAAPVRRLPRDAAQLLGRDQLLSLATAEIMSGTPVEFFGPPGIGKTALLRRLAHRSAGETPGAVLFTWCGPQPVADLQQFVFECLYECDEPVVPTPAQLGSYLQGQRAVVLLDDVELERSQLERLMDALPDGVFVCASPSRRLWGEGRSIELPGLDPEDAVALIERELGRGLAPDERAAARQLATTLRGHPLAILQAAPGLGAPGAEPPAVGPASGALLDALAALPGTPVPTSDLAAVTGVPDAVRELERLEARHLVQAHSPRYSLAGDAHEQPADAQSLRRRLLKHFVATGAAPGDEHDRARRAEYAAPPILALLAAAADDRRPADVLALARGADGLLALGGRWGAWDVLLEQALPAARATRDQTSEAWALHQLGSRALCLGDPALAIASLTSALELREQLGDEPGAAITRHNLGLLGGGASPPPRDGGRGPNLPAVALVSVIAVLVLAIGAALALNTPDDKSGPSVTAQSPPPPLPPPPPGAQPPPPPPAPQPPPPPPPPDNPPPPPPDVPPPPPPPTTTETTPPAKPDLVITSIAPGTDGGISVTVQNAGDAPAGQSELGVSLDENVGSVTAPELGAGDTEAIRVGCPSRIVASRQRSSVTATADVKNAVDESDETNNTRTEVVAC